MRVFISYAQEDRPVTDVIRSSLEADLVEVFCAPESIPGGHPWRDEIDKSIASSDYLLLLWSKNSEKSKWVNYEIASALIHETPIIPLALDNTPTHPQLRDHQAKHWKKEDPESSLLTLRRSLGLPSGEESTASRGPYSLDGESAEATYRQKIVDRYSHLLVLGHDRGVGIQKAYLPLTMVPIEGDAETPFVAHEYIESEHLRIVVFGIPGSGKTTLLRYTAHRTASGGGFLPVFVDIARFMKTADPLVDHLHHIVQGTTNKTIAGLLTDRDDFCGDGTLVLLDGLDEIREAERAPFLERLTTFLTGYPNCHIVVSSRFSNIDFDAFFDLEFSVYKLNALSEKRIEEYIWQFAPPDTRDNLWDLIKANSRLLELAHTPFMLAMLCSSRWEPGSVIDRASLFANCIEYLLKKRGIEHGSKTGKSLPLDEYSRLDGVLRAVAVRFFKLDCSDSFEEQDLEFAITKVAPNSDAHGIIAHLVDRTGLLQRAGDAYCFVHRSIAEYYVALGMKDEPLENLVNRASVPAWEEPIKLHVGLAEASELPQVVEAIWERNRGLALRSLVELPDFPEDLLRTLVGGLARDERVRLSHEIIHASRRAGSRPEEKRTLLDSFSALLRVENDCEVIYNCVVALCDFGDPDCRRLVEQILDLDGAAERRTAYCSDERHCFGFVHVPAGEFSMGYDDSPDARERPAHQVRLSSFDIGQYPVVSSVYYDSFPFSENRRGLGGYSTGDADPVNNVNWYEAIVFAWWLGCDLPTEAEWEYACRNGGKDDPVLFDEKQTPEFAWYEGNSENRTHPVGQRKPNSLELYDMLGNVREWVKDWYSETEFYESCHSDGIVENPLALGGSDRKVLRGGVFDWATKNLRPSYRPMNPPDNVFFGNGMRLVYREGYAVPYFQEGWVPGLESPPDPARDQDCSTDGEETTNDGE